MSWLKWLKPASSAPSPYETIRRMRLTMAGWSEQKPNGNMRIWNDTEGNALSLNGVPNHDISRLASDPAWDARGWARELAEDRPAGLIEADRVPGPAGSAVRLIYKRLELPAYIYTGMFIFPANGVDMVWTVVAGERDLTGEREAIVTKELFDQGKLKTIGDYERSWAQDPYDPDYSGVDRSLLRFISDDESYDQQFPQHPLSLVRQVLRDLPKCMKLEPTSLNT